MEHLQAGDSAEPRRRTAEAGKPALGRLHRFPVLGGDMEMNLPELRQPEDDIRLLRLDVSC